MSAHRQKLIFELSTQEKENRLRTVLAEELAKVVAMNQPVIFRNELCVKPNLFIHQYPDGRKELIELNSNNSEEKIIKILH
mgnify:CR=1 FL=1|jgi:hypothetical protein